MVALGDQVAGVWTSDDALAAGLDAAATASGDKCWRMPLEVRGRCGGRSPRASGPRIDPGVSGGGTTRGLCCV
jgi:leucyl aminopeptidase